MNLYTFILEYKGGTYISQCKAKDVLRAIKKYSKLIVNHELLPGSFFRDAIDEEVKNYSPTPVSGLVGVWVVSPIVKKKLAIINIIESKGFKEIGRAHV